MIAYRVILDEPIGVCVGFKPSGLTTDQIDVFQCEDFGGDKVFILKNDKMVIASSTKVEGSYPEPDLLP